MVKEMVVVVEVVEGVERRLEAVAAVLAIRWVVETVAKTVAAAMDEEAVTVVMAGGEVTQECLWATLAAAMDWETGWVVVETDSVAVSVAVAVVNAAVVAVNVEVVL